MKELLQAIFYMLEATFGVWLWHQLNWYSMYMSLHSFVYKIYKKYESLLFSFSLWTSQPQNILNFLFFITKFVFLLKKFIAKSLREKYPDTELFLVRIFLYSDWIQKIADQQKIRIWTFFTHWINKTYKQEELWLHSFNKECIHLP